MHAQRSGHADKWLFRRGVTRLALATRFSGGEWQPTTTRCIHHPPIRGVAAWCHTAVDNPCLQTRLQIMAHRIHRQIEFRLEHFEGLAGIVSTWSVPYTAVMTRRGVFCDIEADGMPRLLGLSLQVGSAFRDLPPPDPQELLQWQLAWVKDSRHCGDELLERFAQDLQAMHESHLERAA